MSADEGVQGPHALPQSGRQLAPFLGREDARHDVERDQPLVAVLLAVDGEGDADAVEEAVGLGALLSQRVVGLADQPVGVDGVMRADVPVGRVHLVIGRLGWRSIGREFLPRDPSENRAKPPGRPGTLYEPASCRMPVQARMSAPAIAAPVWCAGGQ